MFRQLELLKLTCVVDAVGFIFDTHLMEFLLLDGPTCSHIHSRRAGDGANIVTEIQKVERLDVSLQHTTLP